MDSNLTVTFKSYVTYPSNQVRETELVGLGARPVVLPEADAVPRRKVGELHVKRVLLPHHLQLAVGKWCWQIAVRFIIREGTKLLKGGYELLKKGGC